MKYNLLLLYSGGYDSTLLLKMALEMGYSPLCLLFNYGQVHVEELIYAIDMCEKLNQDYRVVDIKEALSVHSKLTDGEGKYVGVSQWHVPSRNLIFLSIASSIAESEGIRLIWYGANYEDREKLFPDCYQEWVFRLNELLAINGSIPIKVEAPLLGMSKDTIKLLARHFGIEEDKVFSGYGSR